MTDEPKTQRLHILLSPSEVARIDVWGAEHHVRSRADSIRRLVNKGLQAPVLAVLARGLLEAVARYEKDVPPEVLGAVEVIWRDFMAAIGEPLPETDDESPFASPAPPFDDPRAAIERLNRIIHGA